VVTTTTNETIATQETTNTTPTAVAAAPIIPPEPVAPAPPESVAPAPSAAAAPESVSIAAKPRVVTREGYVRKALNVQAPADYELRDVNSMTVTEFLQPDPQDKAFDKFIGARVLVTGAEWLDPRWPKTPILRIQTVDISIP
jgi:hypothetical protein